MSTNSAGTRVSLGGIACVCVSIVAMCTVTIACAQGPATDASFDGLSWMWLPGTDAALEAQPGVVYLRGRFEIPRDARIRRARFVGTADNAFVLYVNGVEAGTGEAWTIPVRIGVRQHLQLGANVIGIQASNDGERPSPAGVIGKFVVELDDAEPIVFPVDATWRIYDRLVPDWTAPDFDDSAWPLAEPAACYGGPPWERFASDNEMRTVPDSFPKFSVPGYEREMESLRHLFYLHYVRCGPKATMWDAWLAPPSLWPATEIGGQVGQARKRWRNALLARGQDADGYIHTHQHISFAHEYGWPFPAWPQASPDAQGRRTAVGWHFHGPRPDMMYMMMLHPLEGSTFVGPKAVEGWEVSGAETVKVDDAGWHIRASGGKMTLTSPAGEGFDTFNAPFLQIRWKQSPPLPENARCYVEWLAEGESEFPAGRMVPFAPHENGPRDALQHCVIAMYKHPEWKGYVERVRFTVEASEPSTEFTIDSLFTVYDTRHPINNSSYIIGVCDYFGWSSDVEFLQSAIGKARRAMAFSQSEFSTRQLSLVRVPWVGHCGRSGLAFDENGAKTIRSGVGIGNNYWDLLPFGGDDMYATSQYYAAVLRLADLEEAILKHPEWNVSADQQPFDPADLRQHAHQVKSKANARFWSDQTGRFAACVDCEGAPHDYGLTFVNLESIYYDIATSAHAQSILDWVTGKRIVEGDTSTGSDIYHWRFAPRATTLRNIDWYVWVWQLPETIPWGGQVQDGGAVLGFSYHDLHARLDVLGPDAAWQRLCEIANWYSEVEDAGGYREYYRDPARGTLQGGGTAGGLGLDAEFFESVLVPHFVLDGLLGFKPRAAGFELRPQLPADFPSLTVTGIHYGPCVLDVEATHKDITIRTRRGSLGAACVSLAPGRWRIEEAEAKPATTVTVTEQQPATIALVEGNCVTLVRQSE